MTDALDRYLDHLLLATPHPARRVCTWWSTAPTGPPPLAAPRAYERAGARVTALAAEPDGWNINDGVGSTHLEGLRAAVVEHGADLGIAHDGDADRCLAVAADGSDVDGDQILAILAMAMHDEGELAARHPRRHRDEQPRPAPRDGGGRDHGAHHRRRRPLRARGAAGRRSFSLGGEQSGHVVLPRARHHRRRPAHRAADHGADGAPPGASLAELAGDRRAAARRCCSTCRWPTRPPSAASPDVADAVAAEEQALAGRGRVLLRPSGTEQLVRVMVEAPTEDVARDVARPARGARRDRPGLTRRPVERAALSRTEAATVPLAPPVPAAGRVAVRGRCGSATGRAGFWARGTA